MEIKLATIENLKKLTHLFLGYLKFYEKDQDRLLVESFLKERLEKKDSVIFIAGDKGFSQMYPSFSSLSQKKSWILNDLFVRSDVRGEGIGKLLLKSACDYSLKSGAKGLSLQTAVDNSVAQKLYETQGWVRDEKYLTYYFSH